MGRRVRTAFFFIQRTRNDYVTRSTTIGLVDENDNILAKCLGRPANDPTWMGTCERALDAMNRARDMVNRPQRPAEGRRGTFKSLFTGYSFGGGQTVSTLSISFFYLFLHHNSTQCPST